MNSYYFHCLIGVLIFFSAPILSADAESPNIVIILADDMGYGDPTCYNEQSRCQTPTIDRLATEGTRFTDAHAAGAWCSPSRYGLLTGRYAFRAGDFNSNRPLIDEQTESLPQMLQRSGYQTAMVGKWHLGFVGGADMTDNPDRELVGGPCDRGFDSFLGLHASLDIPDYFWIRDRHVTQPPTIPIAKSQSVEWWNAIQGKFWRVGKRGEDFVMEDVLDRIGSESVEKIKQLSNGEKPFFLYVALTSPHTPWVPAAEFSDADGAGLYSQFVAHTDAVIGRITEQLRQSQIDDETLVIFTSDNGPTWYQEDIDRFGHSAVANLRGMKSDVHEGGHRVPFVVRWPDHIAAGKTNNDLISFVDVHATLSSIIGSEQSESATDSLDFSQRWLGNRDQAPRNELVTFQAPVAIRRGKWKLITKRGSIGGLSHHDHRTPPNSIDQTDDPAPGQLYDLSVDIGETKNLYEEQPQIVEELTKRLNKM